MTDVETLKKEAGIAACSYVRSGMTVSYTHLTLPTKA